MKAGLIGRSAGYADHIYDFATKYLARDSSEWPTPNGPILRHDYLGVAAAGEAGRYCENWRFPIVEPFYDAALSAEDRTAWNEVTFWTFIVAGLHCR